MQGSSRYIILCLCHSGNVYEAQIQGCLVIVSNLRKKLNTATIHKQVCPYSVVAWNGWINFLLGKRWIFPVVWVFLKLLYITVYTIQVSQSSVSVALSWSHSQLWENIDLTVAILTWCSMNHWKATWVSMWRSTTTESAPMSSCKYSNNWEIDTECTILQY